MSTTFVSGADQGTQYRSGLNPGVQEDGIRRHTRSLKQGLYYFDEDQRELFLASKKAYQENPHKPKASVCFATVCEDALQAAGKHGALWLLMLLLQSLWSSLHQAISLFAEEISTEIRAASDFPDGVFWYAEDGSHGSHIHLHV